MTTPDPEEPQEQEEPAIYHVSFDRLAKLKRSAIMLVAERRVPACPSYQKADHELTDPQKLVNEIAKHCVDEESFIRTEMPIQEIVFRILLSRRNEPTSLHDLHYELTERWATPMRPTNISEVGLRRILDADTYYGFVQLAAD
mgnify:CR=1 FL=1|tara:strand:+ start:2968 stop:3396 length:429 start_codon:yes stop_codon:yes gene_type:complete